MIYCHVINEVLNWNSMSRSFLLNWNQHLIKGIFCFTPAYVQLLYHEAGWLQGLPEMLEYSGTQSLLCGWVIALFSFSFTKDWCWDKKWKAFNLMCIYYRWKTLLHMHQIAFHNIVILKADITNWHYGVFWLDA